MLVSFILLYGIRLLGQPIKTDSRIFGLEDLEIFLFCKKFGDYQTCEREFIKSERFFQTYLHFSSFLISKNDRQNSKTQDGSKSKMLMSFLRNKTIYLETIYNFAKSLKNTLKLACIYKDSLLYYRSDQVSLFMR